ncbi:MAG: hypothetical protein Q9178_007103 [Gyalolechia marmorata]
MARTPSLFALLIIFVYIIEIGIDFFPESTSLDDDDGPGETSSEATPAADVEYQSKGIEKVVEYELETSVANHYAAIVAQGQILEAATLADRPCGLASNYERAGSTGVYTVFAIDFFQDAGFDLTLSKPPTGFNNTSAMLPVISLSSPWTSIIAGLPWAVAL